MCLNLDLLAEDFQNAESTRDRRVLQKIERIRRESLRLQNILEEFLRFARSRSSSSNRPTSTKSLTSCATSASRRPRRWGS